MKVWSEHLTVEDLQDCVARVNREFPGCSVYLGSNAAREGPMLHVGPRTRRIYAVHLRSRTGRRYPNPGAGEPYSREYSSEMAASWTEWGWFLARVFEMDADARCGEYHGLDDFHRQTSGRFEDPRSPRERQVKRQLRLIDGVA